MLIHINEFFVSDFFFKEILHEFLSIAFDTSWWLQIICMADGREDNYVSVPEAFTSGMVAGAMESLISSPFEIIKVRKQVTSASLIPSSRSVAEKSAVVPSIARLLHGYTPDQKALNHSVGLLSTLTSKHPNMIGALQEYPWMMTGSGRPPPVFHVRRPLDVISLEGWGALWRGLRSGVVRDTIFGGVFFSIWQFLHRAMLDWKAAGMDPSPRFYDPSISESAMTLCYITLPIMCLLLVGLLNLCIFMILSMIFIFFSFIWLMGHSFTQ